VDRATADGAGGHRKCGINTPRSHVNGNGNVNVNINVNVNGNINVNVNVVQLHRPVHIYVVFPGHALLL
jgi:hypothetical protein